MAGVRVVGPNEHSIFLTTCGYASDYGITLVGIEGGYWVGIEDVEDTFTGMLIKPSSIAKCLFVDNSGLCSSSPMKYGGKNIRPVVSRKDMITGVFRPSSGEVLFDIEYRNGCLQVKGKAFSGKVTLYDTSGNMVSLRRPMPADASFHPCAKGSMSSPYPRMAPLCTNRNIN